VRYVPIVLVVVLAGCGAGDARHGSTTPHAPPQRPRSPELVAFQRNGGFTATLDTVTVRADGSTRSDKRYGGAGRRYDDFHLRAATLRRLRSALARLPRRIPEVGTGDRTGETYLLRYHGRTYAARSGAVPADLRAAIDTLAAIADGAGRGGAVHEVNQAPTS
jgi:hypothetical protein